MKRLVPAALLLALPVIAQGGDRDRFGIAHKFVFQGLVIVHPWTTAGRGDSADLFMELANAGNSEIVLMGARTRDGAEGALVGYVMKDGEMGLAPLPGIPIAPGQSLELRPDELAIRLDGLERVLEEGQHIDVLLLTSKGEVEIGVMIEAAGARRHSHAGHSH